MLNSIFRSLPRLGRSWKPLNFSNTNFVKIPLSEKIEEETIPDYLATRYYPTRIGEIIRDQYQVVGKLGFGSTSTVWLARDLSHRRHVALKVYIHSAAMGQQLDDEINIYKRIEGASKSHPGRRAIRSLLDSFDLQGPDGVHRCLVHPPMFESAWAFLHRNPIQRLPAPVLAFILQRLFLALDFLHTECKIIHTDIKADNILLGIDDDSVFTDLEEQELKSPCPRKEVDGRTIYFSQDLRMPKKLGAPVLSDFGSAVYGDQEHMEDVQPNIYRAPEVILEVPWSYKIDIWNVGCMIWDVYEGGNLLVGRDPEHQTYRSRAHLAEMIQLLGPPPPHLLARGNAASKFFAEDGNFCAGIPVPDHVPIEERETTLAGDKQEREMFLRLMHKLLQWDPEKRFSASELANDEWIAKHTQM